MKFGVFIKTEGRRLSITPPRHAHLALLDDRVELVAFCGANVADYELIAVRGDATVSIIVPQGSGFYEFPVCAHCYKAARKLDEGSKW